MMRVALYTLGCKLNQVESEGIADAFRREGFQPVAPSQEADIYIVNTCTVTSKAEQKARRMIRKFASQPHEPLLLITGCYAELDGELLRKSASRLLILPMDQKASLMRLPASLNHSLEEGLSAAEGIRRFFHSGDTGGSPFDYRPDVFTYHARAFLKIEDGCDNECTYCRVRIARGKAVSLPADEVLSRCLDLERRGYREIVLTGVNISAYRDDRTGLAELLQLLSRRLSEPRIRLSSVEPDMLTDEMIEAFGLPIVQPHIHLPIQSGSPRMIARIGRSYRPEDVTEAVRKLREVKEDPFIAADMITGLPGEDEADFKASCDLAAACGLSQLHVFPYSPRPGTALYGAKDRVSEYIRDQRARELRELSRRQHQDYVQRQHHRVVTAVAEERITMDERPFWRVLTENYLHGVVEEKHLRLERGQRCTLRLDTSSGTAVGTPAD